MPGGRVILIWAGFFLCLTGSAFAIETDCGNATIPETECECLVNLYNNAGGREWLDSPENNWNHNDDPGTWIGVQVSAGHVIGIHRSGMNLAGTIPDLSGLSRLEAIDLSDNALSGEITASIFPAGLLTLSLAHNQLLGQIGEFAEVPELLYLNLSYNRIRGAISDFATVGGLQYLFVEGNAIDGEIPLSIANTGILNLGLGYNKLSVSDGRVMDFVLSIDHNWENTQTVPPGNINAEFSGEPGTVYVSWTPIRYTGDGGHYKILRATESGGAYFQIGQTANKHAGDIEISGLVPGPAHISVAAFTPAHETPYGFQQNDLTSSPGTPVHVIIPDFPPVIVGQQPLTTFEDIPLEIRLADLVVEDPDSAWPDGFTLAVLEGNGYTVEDNTMTPARDFNGKLYVLVKVNDGTADSGEFQVRVDVFPVNDAPVIIGQNPLATTEETGLKITLEDLDVYDPDSNPEDFTLVVQEGVDYFLTDNTIVPLPDFNGELSVRAYVSDGLGDGNPAILMVGVAPVNDIPLIVAQRPLEIAEDTSIEIVLDDLTVIDPDSQYPENFSLAVLDGQSYTHYGNTVIPETDFNGKLEVATTVNDGLAESAAINVFVNVMPVNDPPRFASEPIVGATQTVVYLWEIETVDPDRDDSRTIRAATVPSWLDLIDYGDGTAKLEGTPTNIDVGEHLVEMVVEDAESATDSRGFVITVSHVSDAPIIAGQKQVFAIEDTPFAPTLEDLEVSEPDGTYPAGFSLTIRDGKKYTIADGKILPDKNFFGILTVPLTVNDGTVDSNVFNLKATIIPANDPPEFISAPVTSASVNRNYKYGITVTDPDSNEILSLSAPLLPGWLSFTDHGNGRATLSGNPGNPGRHEITLKAQDASGSEAFQAFDIVVTEVNTIPVITGQKDLSVSEEMPLTVTAAHLAVSDPLGEYPAGFSVFLKNGPDYTVEGNTIWPAEDFNGMLTVPATVGNENMESDIWNLDVRVMPVNDPPVFVSVAVDTAVRDMNYFYEITVHDPDGDPVSISGRTIPSWLALADNGDGTATLSGMPGKEDAGTHEVALAVADSAGETDVQAFVLKVADSNDAPAIVGQMRLTTFENTPIDIYLADLVVNDPDNNYPEGFALAVMDGTGYVGEGNTVVPNPGFTGRLAVPVRVNDGTADSNVYQLAIEVIVPNGQNLPPDAPAAESWTDGAVFPAGPVTLKSSPYSDPEGDRHTVTVWMIRLANGPDKCPDESDRFDFVAKAQDGSSGNKNATRSAMASLTEYTASNLIPGLEYVWRVGHRDSGSGLTSWSPFYAFMIGDDREGPVVNVEPGTSVSEYEIVTFPGFNAADDVFGEVPGESYDRTRTRIFAYHPSDGYLEYAGPDSAGAWGGTGRAYWVLARHGLSIPTRGIAIGSDPHFEIGLAYDSEIGNGWNLVGCPGDSDYDWGNVEIVAYDGDCGVVFGPVPVSDLESSDFIDPRLWRWEDGRYHADTAIMENCRGYWVRANRANVSLRFVAGPQTGGTHRRRSMESSETDGPPAAPGSDFGSEIDPKGGGCFFSSTW